jgi:hypothetical protein
MVADERSTHGNPEVAFRDFGRPLHQTITGKTGVADRPRAVGVTQGAGPHDRLRPGVARDLGRALQPVADHEERVLDPPVLQVGQHAHPELGALPAFPALSDPKPEDVLVPGQGDPDRGVNRPAGDAPDPRFHHYRVGEDRRTSSRGLSLAVVACGAGWGGGCGLILALVRGMRELREPSSADDRSLASGDAVA